MIPQRPFEIGISPLLRMLYLPPHLPRQRSPQPRPGKDQAILRREEYLKGSPRILLGSRSLRCGAPKQPVAPSPYRRLFFPAGAGIAGLSKGAAGRASSPLQGRDLTEPACTSLLNNLGGRDVSTAGLLGSKGGKASSWRDDRTGSGCLLNPRLLLPLQNSRGWGGLRKRVKGRRRCRPGAPWGGLDRSAPPAGTEGRAGRHRPVRERGSCAKPSPRPRLP